MHFKIKLKIKTLAALVLCSILLGATVYYFVVPYTLYSKGAYAEVIERYPHSHLVERALQRAASSSQSQLLLTDIGPSGHSASGTNEHEIPIEKAIEYNKRLIYEYPERTSRARDMFRLATLYLRSDEWELAGEWFEKIATENEPDILALEAKDIFTALESQLERSKKEEPLLSGQVWLGDQVEKKLFVQLYPADHHSRGSHFSTHFPVVTPDEDGFFRFYDVEPGEYVLNVRIFPEKITNYVRVGSNEKTITIEHGKSIETDIYFNPLHSIIGSETTSDEIRLEWEPFEGAAYYKVGLYELLLRDGNLSRTGGSMLEDKWERTEAVLDIEELRHYFPVISKGTDGLDPSSVLGYVYPGGTFTWSVNAYDENDLLISSTGAYSMNTEELSAFTLDSTGMLEGDRFVIQQDFESAIEAYEQNLDQPAALRALARIYAHGTELHSDGDSQQALYYLRQIENPTEADRQLLERLKKE